MENSGIEWCHHTQNFWIGCAKVSAGCQHCYAEMLMDTRYGRVEWGPKGTRKRTSPANWRKPYAWNRQAQAAGERYRVFCSSLADVFEDRPEIVPWRADLWKTVEETPHLDWLLLTKRPENISRMVPAGGCPPNAWLGTSIEDRKALKRIPILTSNKASVHFLSVEPLLEDLGRLPLKGVEWVIVGGESGGGARPMNPEWVRNIRRQCEDAKVAFFFKQWGGVRKVKGDNVLDGKRHLAFPRDPHAVKGASM